MIRSLPLAGLGVGVALTIACTASTSAPDDAVQSRAVRDAEQIIRRPDGNFDVTCRDGRREVAMAEEILADTICAPPGGSDAGAAPQCLIVGPAEYQVDFGSRACNDCVRSNCCRETDECFRGDSTSGVITADGGVSACSDRFSCRLNCMFHPDPAAPDVAACNARCDSRFDDVTNRKEKAVYECIYVDHCASSAAGSPLCEP